MTRRGYLSLKTHIEARFQKAAVAGAIIVFAIGEFVAEFAPIDPVEIGGILRVEIVRCVFRVFIEIAAEDEIAIFIAFGEIAIVAIDRIPVIE